MNRSTRAVALCAAFALAGCVGTEEEAIRTRRPADPVVSESAPQLDEQRLADFGMSLYWASPLRGEVITGVFLEGQVLPAVDRKKRTYGAGKPCLYAFTKAQRLYQIDLNSGNVNWVYEVGRELMHTGSGRPITEFVFRPSRATRFKTYDEVYFVAGDHLYALDKTSGAALWITSLDFPSASPPEATRSYVFVGGHDDRVYAFNKEEPEFPAWNWRTDDDVSNRPATLPRNPNVFVASTDGSLYTFPQNAPKPRTPFKTERRIVHDPIMYQNKVYVAAEDYNLYVIDAISGRLDTRFGAESPISGTPVISANSAVGIDYSIYFPAEGKGLFAMRRGARPEGARRDPHEVKWNHPTATRFLCRGLEDAYLMEPTDEFDSVKVTRVDALAGNQRDSMTLSGVDYLVTNPNSPKAAFEEEKLVGGILVLGYRNGWILALKETKSLPGGEFDVAPRRAVAAE
ncbi:MAG: PQQ-binding-like beta-propeller repeat protein [Planctomycetes bacterium]|nr:PQQ-binding-like beta-propeller repeat protein [Planctomycetota bacterium]